MAFIWSISTENCTKSCVFFRRLWQDYSDWALVVGARFWGNGSEEIGQAAPDTFQVLHQHGSETTKTITNIARIVLFWSVKLTYRAALGQLKRQRQQRQSLWLKKDRIQFVRQRQGNLVQKNKGKLWIFPHCSSTVSTSMTQEIIPDFPESTSISTI